jgi:hypothetical protein
LTCYLLRQASGAILIVPTEEAMKKQREEADRQVHEQRMKFADELDHDVCWMNMPNTELAKPSARLNFEIVKTVP